MEITILSSKSGILRDQHIVGYAYVCPRCAYLAMPLNLKRTEFYCYGCGGMFGVN